MTSTRYDGDTWDLASSVGATATMAAAARAIATRADRRLIDDPFAEPELRTGDNLAPGLVHALQATLEADPEDW